MSDKTKMEIFIDTQKKIRDLKEFNIPVIQQTIKEYEENNIEQLFIDQQKALLEKVYARLNELEAKSARLLDELDL